MTHQATSSKSSARTVLFLAAILVLVAVVDIARGGSAEAERSGANWFGGGCNVGVVELYGDLYTYGFGTDYGDEEYESYAYPVAFSQYITDQISAAENDDSIRAILIDVDSYGGLPVAGEEIANGLRRSSKPTVAVVRQAALSAAYWAASGADIIVASRNSDIGSIGATSSFVDEAEKNQNEGIRYNDLTSAKFKDLGNPNREMTEEERALVLRDLRIVHENFVEDVANNRGVPREAIAALADGSSMLGLQAFESGLVDMIGGMFEAEEYLSELIGEEIETCLITESVFD